MLLLLQLLQQIQGRDDALGVVLLVALTDGQQVAVQLLGMLGEILNQIHVAGYAGLHIQGAAAEQIFAGLDIVNDLLGQYEGLTQLGGQLLAAEGVLTDGAEIVHPNGIDVADEDDRAVRIALGALHIGQRTVPHHKVVLGLEAPDLLRVCPEVGQGHIEVLHIASHSALAARLLIDAGDGDHVFRQLLDRFKRI